MTRGLTSIELIHGFAWPMGLVTDVLCGIERPGHVRRLPVHRAHQAAYVVTTVVATAIAFPSYWLQRGLELPLPTGAVTVCGVDE